MSTDAVYMLSWAGVIYNDILGPFRKNWSEKRGILINRFIVAVIGVFLLVYGLWYPLKGNLWNYIIVTGTIYMSSMSVLLIACCYWKRANSWGAGAAIVIGAALPVAYLVLEQIKATEHFAREVIGVNIWGICTFVLTAAAMIIGSLIKPGKTFNIVAAEAAAKTGA
jgi:SSS family solute:Na+ symporter